MNAANSDLSGYSFSLNIYGGTLYVDAQSGDGLDSNGTMTLSGGTVEVYSAGQGDNAPLDADGIITLSSSALVRGQTYTLLVNGTSPASAMAVS